MRATWVRGMTTGRRWGETVRLKGGERAGTPYRTTTPTYIYDFDLCILFGSYQQSAVINREAFQDVGEAWIEIHRLLIEGEQTEQISFEKYPKIVCEKKTKSFI